MVGRGLPGDIMAIVGNEPIPGIGVVWVLTDASCNVLDVGLATSSDHAQYLTLEHANTMVGTDPRAGRRKAVVRSKATDNRNYRRNARLAVVKDASAAMREKMERLFNDAWETKQIHRTDLQILLCEMSIKALAAWIEKCSAYFINYINDTRLSEYGIAETINSFAEQILDLAPTSREDFDGEAVYHKVLDLSGQLRQHGFMLDRELFEMTRNYCYMGIVPGPRTRPPNASGPDHPPLANLDWMLAQNELMNKFITETQQINDELLAHLLAATYQYKLWAKHSPPVPIVIIVMGASGSGKTSVGKALAQRLHCPFIDADQFHPEMNRAKMAAGQPLTDADRLPWLNAVGSAIRAALQQRTNHVFACSALKAGYRHLLDPDHQCKLVYLRGSPEVLAERLAGRGYHFFHPDLLQSQLDTLDEPEDAAVIDITQPLPAIVDELVALYRT